MKEGTTIRGAGLLTDLALSLDPQCNLYADTGGTLRFIPSTTLFASTNSGLMQSSGTNSLLTLTRKDIALATEALLSSAGNVDEKKAREWIKRNLNRE